ncbi:hypothetical protein ABK040_004517 [Willaertia magna]
MNDTMMMIPASPTRMIPASFANYTLNTIDNENKKEDRKLKKIEKFKEKSIQFTLDLFKCKSKEFTEEDYFYFLDDDIEYYDKWIYVKGIENFKKYFDYLSFSYDFICQRIKNVESDSNPIEIDVQNLYDANPQNYIGHWKGHAVRRELIENYKDPNPITKFVRRISSWCYLNTCYCCCFGGEREKEVILPNQPELQFRRSVDERSTSKLTFNNLNNNVRVGDDVASKSSLEEHTFSIP